MKKKLKIILGIVFSVVFSAVMVIVLPENTVNTKAAEISIDEMNFPDYKFRNYVLQNCDTDNNNKLSEEEIAATISIKIPYEYNRYIYSLDGIEYFTALTILDCGNNELTNLDLSSNTALIELDCGDNELTNLDLSSNTALIELDCNDNELTNLDLSSNTALIELDCGGNELTNLDLSSNTALITLICHYNNFVNLDLSKNIVLEKLVCNNSELVSLDLSKNTALRYLYCSSNQLTSLDLSKNINLEYLDCMYNQLTNLDLSQNTALEHIICYFNQLTSLNLGKNTCLTRLSCMNNQLTSLDLSQNTALEDIVCYSNQLIDLDLGQNTCLKYLSCDSNQLTSLDLSQNIALEDIGCTSNQLTDLDLSQNTCLKYLSCDSNQLTDLDLSKNTDLIGLYCYDNQLTSLNLSKNTDLRSLSCDNNKLTELDLSHNILLCSLELDGSLSYTGNKLQNIKLSTCLYPYTGLWNDDDVTILDNIRETDYGFVVIDLTKPATYQYSYNGESIKCTLTYVNPYNETISTPVSDKHLFNDHEYTSPVSGSSIVIYGNGGIFKTGSTKTTNKQFTVYTDITASYVYTLNNKGITKASSGKVIAGITKSDIKPVVTKNKIIDTNAAKIARAKIKNGQITVTATGKEGGIVYLWVIDTGSKGIYECCPINVRMAPKKLEVQDKSGRKLTNPKLEIDKTLDVCVAGIISGTTKTNDCTYTATVDSACKSYIQVTQNGTPGNYTIKAIGLKNNKNTKVSITFKCDQNEKKVKLQLTIIK